MLMCHLVELTLAPVRRLKHRNRGPCETRTVPSQQHRRSLTTQLSRPPARVSASPARAVHPELCVEAYYLQRTRFESVAKGSSADASWTRTTPLYSPVSTPNSTACRSAFRRASSGPSGATCRPIGCVVQKHRNLRAYAPQRLHEEVSADYNDMIYATSAAEIEAPPCLYPQMAPQVQSGSRQSRRGR